MAAKDWSREIAAISPYIQGVTTSVQGECTTPIPGITQTIESTVAGVASLTDASIDTIVSIAGFEQLTDPVSGLRHFRRALRENGNLVLVVQAPSEQETLGNRYSPQHLASLIVLVSGFEVQTIEEISNDTYIAVFARSAVNEVRQPMGTHGPDIVQQVNSSDSARAEFYFQIGTLMLQTGDQEWAVQSFQNVLTMEPDNAEAFFGLGMTLGTQNRWVEALVYLQRAERLDPANTEVQRWIQLAQQQQQGQAPQVAQPQPIAQPQPTAQAAPVAAAPMPGPIQQEVQIPQSNPNSGGQRTPSLPRGASPVPNPSGTGPGQGGIPNPSAQNPAPSAVTSSLRI